MIGAYLRQVNEFLKGVAVFAQKRAFIILVFFATMLIIWIGFIFYQYGYKASTAVVEERTEEISIDFQLHEKITRQLEEKKKRLEQAQYEDYSDPFR